MSSKRIYYFDSGATTKPHKEVVQCAYNTMKDTWGNPSSLNDLGKSAMSVIETARDIIAVEINAELQDIYFSPTASMSNSLLLKTVCQQQWTKEWGCHIVTSSIEHSSILNTCKFLEKNGVEVTYLPVDSNGFVSVDDLRKSIKTNTVLVSIIAASNEFGTIQPIKQLAEQSHSYGVPFHTDATQLMGKDWIDVTDWDVDFMTASAHKIHGLRGAALLYYRPDNFPVLNSLVNGGRQESGIIAGTENTAAIAAFGRAVSMISLKCTTPYIAKMRNYLLDRLLSIPDSHINGVDIRNRDAEHLRLANNLNIRFDGIGGQELQQLLADKGIYISTGSACNAGNKEASKALMALGLSEAEALSSVRITLSEYNTMEECDYLAKWTEYYVNLLRKRIHKENN